MRTEFEGQFLTFCVGFDLDHMYSLYSSFFQVPLMEKSGRRPLLLIGMGIMVLSASGLTAALNLQGTITWMAYVSILCLITFVVGFAIGLGQSICNSIQSNYYSSQSNYTFNQSNNSFNQSNYKSNESSYNSNQSICNSNQSNFNSNQSNNSFRV